MKTLYSKSLFSVYCILFISSFSYISSYRDAPISRKPSYFRNIQKINRRLNRLSSSSKDRLTHKVSDIIPIIEEEDVLPIPIQPARKDNVGEKFLIFIVSLLLANIAEDKKSAKQFVYPGMPFEGFISTTKVFSIFLCMKMFLYFILFFFFFSNSKVLLQENSAMPSLLHNKIVGFLASVVPIFIREQFRSQYIDRPQWVCEKSAEFMSFGLLSWLVGPVERFQIPTRDIYNPIDNSNSSIASSDMIPHSSSSTIIDSPLTVTSPSMRPQMMNSTDSTSFLYPNNADMLTPQMTSDPQDTIMDTKTWRSGVKLTECRYLLESGCKSACVNLCKKPTQQFFSQELGLPLYMKPNFTDCSCELFFGVQAPVEEEDPVFKQNCYSSCSMKKVKRSIKC
jgi:hypothetical protein